MLYLCKLSVFTNVVNGQKRVSQITRYKKRQKHKTPVKQYIDSNTSQFQL